MSLLPKRENTPLIQVTDCLQIQRSGSTVDGTFCEYAVAAVDYVVPIPDSLSDPEAAPLMCAVSKKFTVCGLSAKFDPSARLRVILCTTLYKRAIPEREIGS